MDNLEKENIRTELLKYCERYRDASNPQDTGQNKAAASLKDVSGATLSQMISRKWDLISDKMWRNVSLQISKNTKWKAVETTDFKQIRKILTDAKDNSLVMAITGGAGSGKTFALTHFAETNKQVYLLSCNEYWNRKLFLSELLTKLGKDNSGTVGEMMTIAVNALRNPVGSLLILDEADKLSDQVLYFFITMYNQLEDECGIVLCATSFLEKRLKRGIKLNKKGYNEIWSRLGRKCIELKGVTAKDIVDICSENDITEKKTLDMIISDSEGDLRRVKRKIHALAKKQLKTA